MNAAHIRDHVRRGQIDRTIQGFPNWYRMWNERSLQRHAINERYFRKHPDVCMVIGGRVIRNGES